MSRDERAAFGGVWDSDGPRVAAYARRHVAPDDVHDVVSETFLQAWRRWDDVPTPPLPWLIATARKVIGNSRRSARRRGALHQRVALLDSAARDGVDAGVVATERLAALQALAGLSEEHREALLLVAWDGLTVDEAARVLGIRPGTLRVRSHRARAALDPDHTPSRRVAAGTRQLSEGGLE